MATELTVIDLVGETTPTAEVSADLTTAIGDATEGDHVFAHIMFSNRDVVLDETNDWDVVEFHRGPTYASALLHAVLGETPDLEVEWTGSSLAAYHFIAIDDIDDVDSHTVTPSLGSAVLQRLVDLPPAEDVHILCFAGSINTGTKLTTSVNPDVGFLNTQDVENGEVAGAPVLWVGDFPGPYGDTDVTVGAAVYYDPPPSHSVGYTVALELDNS